mmetsp:Transcript_86556/g.190027  ORF Transcript_86556/g.190027 Transcript_86556/m.190027 type:complete len:262 (+) Transcript_86556:225-1010(+)
MASTISEETATSRAIRCEYSQSSRGTPKHRNAGKNRDRTIPSAIWSKRQIITHFKSRPAVNALDQPICRNPNNANNASIMSSVQTTIDSPSIGTLDVREQLQHVPLFWSLPAESDFGADMHPKSCGSLGLEASGVSVTALSFSAVCISLFVREAGVTPRHKVKDAIRMQKANERIIGGKSITPVGVALPMDKIRVNASTFTAKLAYQAIAKNAAKKNVMSIADRPLPLFSWVLSYHSSQCFPLPSTKNATNARTSCSMSIN